MAGKDREGRALKGHVRDEGSSSLSPVSVSAIVIVRAGLWLCRALGQSILRGPLHIEHETQRSINLPKVDCVRVVLFYARDSKLASYRRMFTSRRHSIFFYNLCISTHTHTTVLRLCGICPGKPGWAGTRRTFTHYSHRSHQSSLSAFSI